MRLYRNTLPSTDQLFHPDAAFATRMRLVQIIGIKRMELRHHPLHADWPATVSLISSLALAIISPLSLSTIILCQHPSHQEIRTDCQFADPVLSHFTYMARSDALVHGHDNFSSLVQIISKRAISPRKTLRYNLELNSFLPRWKASNSKKAARICSFRKTYGFQQDGKPATCGDGRYGNTHKSLASNSKVQPGSHGKE